MNQRACLYLRVSSDEQSTDLQRDDLIRYAELRGWKVVEVFEDHWTGTNDQRPAFQKMMKAAHERQFDVVCCWRFDRFGRNIRNLIENIQTLDSLGIHFCSFKDQVDMSTPQGRLFAHLLFCFSQFEVESLKQRTIAGMAAAKARGAQIGRPRKVDPVRVGELRSQGLSISEIARQLGISRASVSETVKKGNLRAPVRKGMG
jgi:DNA invertase Pin-like site-specific DNA recombinase